MNVKKGLLLITILLFIGWGLPLVAADELPKSLPDLVNMDKGAFLSLKNQLRIIAFLTAISLIPFGVMMMTSFTRISIVFMFLRQALGSSQVPSNQIIIGLSLILTGFVMHPVIEKVQKDSLTPYLRGEFDKLPGVISGAESEESILLYRAWIPLRDFLMSHIREKDLELFMDIGRVQIQAPVSGGGITLQQEMEAVPWYCLVPAFMLSELRTAFMMGFVLFLPFLIIDMIVAAVLMSMGMMMLPPIMVSTPFKLLLFIMIDGWRLIVYQIINGFQGGG